MTTQPETTQPQTPSKRERLVAGLTTSRALAGALGVLILLTGVTVWQNHSERAVDHELTCLGMVYQYPEDEDGYTDYDADPEKVAFSDLNSVERAQADLLDCDIEGR